MNRPLVRDWKKDLVYLIQMPRAGCVPSLSPFALKLETWLRIAHIPYQNVDNEFKFKSSRGQIPFIELNGRQISDTEVIISELTRVFNVKMDEHLSDFSMAEAIAFHSLIEDRLRWQCWYYRALNNRFFGTRDGLAGHFKRLQGFFFRTFVLARMRSNLKQQCRAQGIGLLAPYEVNLFVKKDLKAVSTFLSEKPYMMGEKVCTFDATAFGHLSMFYFCPMNTEIKEYIDSDCQNIVGYLKHMKAEFWPDWEEITEKLSLALQLKSDLTEPPQNLAEPSQNQHNINNPDNIDDELPTEPIGEDNNRNANNQITNF